MGGGGKSGGQIKAPMQREIGDFLLGNLYQKSLERSPKSIGMFGSGTATGKKYRDLFGGEPTPGPGVKKPPTYGGITRGARESLGYTTPGEDVQFGGGVKFAQKGTEEGKGGGTGGMQVGAGQLTKVAGGTTTQFTTPSYQPQQYQQQQISTPQLKTPQQVTYDPQQFQQLRQVGAEQIGRGARQATQGVMREYGARGLGRSGLALQAAQRQYERGAGQQISQLNRTLSSQEMAQQFGEQQMLRNLQAQQDVQQGQFAMEAQRQNLEQAYRQAGLSQAEASQRAEFDLRTQQSQAGESLSRRSLGLQEALGLGELGLKERGLDQKIITDEMRSQDIISQILGGLGQSAIAGGSQQQQGGKGK